ncbi:GDP-fucose protein O-fucosyltransferase, partial [Datura stramonium]|nr:GDP-fucose protein O-fucosyltransferase [Datura stramonium]
MLLILVSTIMVVCIGVGRWIIDSLTGEPLSENRATALFLDDEHVKKLKSLGVYMNKLETAWDEDVKNPKPRTVQDIMKNFSLDDGVIAIGDVFFANVEKKWLLLPVPQAADCNNRAVERSTAPVIYLSTDVAESETGLLQSLVVVYGKTVPLVRRPARNSDEKWDALVYRHDFEGDGQ